jgi:ssDNA-binding Zn-finger/Zn-ribbon topoisomerase 1
MSKDKPVPKKCPRCHSPYLVEKVSRHKGKKPVAFLKCPNENCNFEEITE